MTAPRGPVLYSPALLALAVDLANYPFNPSASTKGHARSRTCGSTVDISSSHAEHVSDLGLKVAACAVGQAAATVFARSASGMTRHDCSTALDEIRAWLEARAGLPSWPGMEVLAPARGFPGRHEAIQLPWRAALDALCNEAGGG
ncbi:MAG: iron-sulfur cluster assembly scaffold protein [Erythrobacter sp.]